MKNTIKFTKFYLSCIKEIEYKSSKIEELLKFKITFA